MLNRTKNETELSNIYQILIFSVLCLAAKGEELIFFFRHVSTLQASSSVARLNKLKVCKEYKSLELQ